MGRPAACQCGTRHAVKRKPGAMRWTLLILMLAGICAGCGTTQPAAPPTESPAPAVVIEGPYVQPAGSIEGKPFRARCALVWNDAAGATLSFLPVIPITDG